MGTGSRYYRAALGQAMGESQAIQDHTKKMIPLIEQQAEVELKIAEKKQELELQRYKNLADVMRKFPGSKSQQIVYSQPAAASAPPDGQLSKKNLLILAGVAIAAWYFLLR